MAELNARIIAKASATAAEEPLAGDLEVAELAVNTADGKLFTKHTDGSIVTISGGGGGGAVDSVNDQTGVVSLGIQDMDDYELVDAVLGTPVTRTEDSGASNNITSGEVGTVLTNSAPWRTSYWSYDPEGKDTGTVLDYLLTAPMPTTITINGTDLEVESATDDAAANCLVIKTTATFDANSIVGSEWTLSVSTGKIPLAQGDILQWDDANQKFEPAQAPVGSVNSQTGVVSLGIQDMDDYILRSQGESAIATWSGTWTIRTLSNNQCSAAGGIGPGTDNGNGANICIIDGDGNDRTTELDAFANSSLWFSVNGGLWTEATTGNIVSTCTPKNKLTGCPDLYTAINAAQIGDTISLSDGTPPSYIPLAEGDILQWNDTDQKFNPAQLPTGGAVDSVNGETGAVVLDVEDLDNVRSLFAGLSLPTRDSSICSNGNNDTWDANSSNFFYTAKGGATEVLMNQLQIGDSITFNWSDGGSETKTVTTVNTSGCASASYINTDTNLTLEPTTGGVILTSNRWDSGAATDGQVLTWVNTNNQWEPAQLPDATATRVLLGIGEYVDDAAAGTGGVASGAMYYNTTSSDYRLKP